MPRLTLHLAVVIAALAAIWATAWVDYRHHVTEHREEFGKLGGALLGASEGTVVRLCRGGRYDPTELESAVEEVRAKLGAVRLELVSSEGQTVAVARAPGGAPPEGSEVFAESFALPEPRGQGLGRGAGPALTPLPDGDVRLELELGCAALDRRMTADLRRFLGIGAALSLAVISLFVLLELRLRSALLAERLERTRQELAGLEFLGRLGAGLAHETRNPLGIVHGHAQGLLEGDADPEAVRGAARTIVEETERTLARLDEFLLLSRPAEPRRAAFELHGLLAELCALLVPDLERRAAAIELAEFELEVRADRDQVRRLLLNLLLNAAQAIGPQGRIRIELARGPRGADLRVIDDGPGVPAELRPTLFEPYVSAREGGTGLGLAIARRIALEHGWRLEHEPAPGGGAVFTVAIDPT